MSQSHFFFVEQSELHDYLSSGELKVYGSPVERKGRGRVVIRLAPKFLKSLSIVTKNCNYYIADGMPGNIHSLDGYFETITEKIKECNYLMNIMVLEHKKYGTTFLRTHHYAITKQSYGKISESISQNEWQS